MFEPDESRSHPNMIRFEGSFLFLSELRSCKWQLPFRCCECILHAYIFSHASYIPHSSHALWFKHPDNVCLGAQIQLAVSYVQIFPSSCFQTLLNSIPPLGWVAKFHVHTKRGSIILKHLETWTMKISSLMSLQAGIFQTWISNTTIY
jgi:hypothetical protein